MTLLLNYIEDVITDEGRTCAMLRPNGSLDGVRNQAILRLLLLHAIVLGRRVALTPLLQKCDVNCTCYQRLTQPPVTGNIWPIKHAAASLQR